MDVTKKPDGSIELMMNTQEVYWLTGILNECCHGFPVTDFSSRVGAEKSAVVKILDQILAA